MALQYQRRFEEWLPADFDGLFHWDFLKDWLPRGIEPHDFDAVIEIGGNFLVFETKNDGARISVGQRIALNALLQYPNWTVLILFGKTAAAISRLIILDGLSNPTDINPATIDDVKNAVITWRKRADWLYEKRKEQKALASQRDWLSEVEL